MSKSVVIFFLFLLGTVATHGKAPSCDPSNLNLCKKSVREYYAQVEGRDSADFSIFHSGCVAGDSVACGIYALAIKNGLVKGVNNYQFFDEKQFLALTKDCFQGDGLACRFAARSLNEELFVPRSGAQDAEAFLKAGCKHRDGWSCAALGIANGGTTAENQEDTLRHLVLGCAYNSGEACFALGNSFLHGDQLPKSNFEAYKFFDLGCQSGHEQSCKSAKRIWLFSSDAGIGLLAIVFAVVLVVTAIIVFLKYRKHQKRKRRLKRLMDF